MARNRKIMEIQIIKFSPLSISSFPSFHRLFSSPNCFYSFRLSFSFLKMEKNCWWICLYSAGCIQHWWPYHKCKCYRAFNILLPNTPNWTGIPLTLTKEHTNYTCTNRGKYRWSDHQDNYFYIIMIYTAASKILQNLSAGYRKY